MQRRKQLTEFAIEAASVGCGQTRKQIMTIAENIAKDKGILQKDRISTGWYDRDRPTFHFAKDILLQMIGWMRLHHRQLNINLLEKALKDNNLLNKPA